MVESSAQCLSSFSCIHGFMSKFVCFAFFYCIVDLFCYKSCWWICPVFWDRFLSFTFFLGSGNVSRLLFHLAFLKILYLSSGQKIEWLIINWKNYEFKISTIRLLINYRDNLLQLTNFRKFDFYMLQLIISMN
jgi:hypothetical protein